MAEKAGWPVGCELIRTASLAEGYSLGTPTAGRAEAERRHLLVTGTLGVLAEAHRARLLDFEVALAQLRQTNFYVSADLVARVRRLSTGVGES